MARSVRSRIFPQSSNGELEMLHDGNEDANYLYASVMRDSPSELLEDGTTRAQRYDQTSRSLDRPSPRSPQRQPLSLDNDDLHDEETFPLREAIAAPSATMSYTFLEKLSVTFDFVFTSGTERRPKLTQHKRLPLYNDGPVPSLKSRHLRSESPDSAAYRAARPRQFHRRRMERIRKIFSISTLITFIKYLLPTLLLVIMFIRWNYEFYYELNVYEREWAHREVKKIEPLAGCFDAHRISPAYNISDAIYGPKLFQVHAGVPMRIGMDCYNYAGTLKMQPFHPKRIHHVNVHSYWRVDLVPFGDRQEQTLKSFFATQDLDVTKLILWSNGDLRGLPHIDRWLRRYPDSFEVRIIDVEEWARGTALEGSPLLKVTDDRAWVDGDLVRLLVTWAHGGVWLDMDSLLTRDLTPLLDHEFVTQWDCFDKMYQTLNGALMHFFQHSPYLCEAFHIMARSNPPRSGSTDWGSLLYLKLWRRLIAAGVPPFKILPFCFSDGRSCRRDNQLPDPFKEDPRTWGGGRSLKEGGELDEILDKVFVVHLHNQWKFNFPIGGWVDRLLLRRYDGTLRRRYIEEQSDYRRANPAHKEAHGRPWKRREADDQVVMTGDESISADPSIPTPAPDA